MRPTPINEVMRRIRPLPPAHKAAHLRGLIASEPRRSIRRRELELALQDVVNKQLCREIRQDRRAS
jgi:hypothetical protein